MTNDRWGSGRRPLRGADDDPNREAEPAGLAPVIPLFAARRGDTANHPAQGKARLAPAPDDHKRLRDANPLQPESAPFANRARSGDRSVGGRGRWGGVAADDDAPDSSERETSPDEVRAQAEALLLRKLRSRSLSISEAQAVVRGVEGADDATADEVIDHFVDLGYLDDAAFAEQLAMSAVERRGEGRRALAETLRKRGIPRDIAEAALAELPDDDAERALEFARSKVRSVEGKEYEASLRRLAGQLARRGYPSSVALTAARTALSEAGMGRTRSFSRPPSGVRFTPDD